MADIAQEWFSNGPMSVPYRDNVAIVRLTESANPSVLSTYGGNIAQTPARDIWQVSYDSQSLMDAAIAGFGQSQFIVWAEPLGEVSVNLIPNDPLFYAEWGLHNTGQQYASGLFGTVDADIDAPEAWDRRTSALSVVTADIDTGVNYLHPDLYKNIWINQGEIPEGRLANLTDVDSDGLITFWDLNEPINIGAGKITDLNGNGFIDGGDLLVPMAIVNGQDVGGGWANGVSDEGDVWVDDIIGWDFHNNDNNPMDDHGHGTHTSGTIGAIGDNGIGVTGVAWKAQIMSLKFLAANGFGSTVNGANAVVYSTLKGATVSNNSWGGGPFLNQLYSAINQAGAAGQLFIASAGNDATNIDPLSPQNQIAYPAAYDLPNIISVASITATNGLSSFSNYGANLVDLGAPGDIIGSTYHNLGQPYVYMSGTSMAAPHVSGAAALVKAQRPSWGWSEIKTHLLSTVDPLASLAGKTVTGGRLNLQKALANLAPTDVALAGNSVAENQPAATTVGTLSSTDPDLGDTFTYTLVTGTGDTDNSSFSIAGGTLQTATAFDFETKSSYSIRVRTTDQDGLFVEKVFTISVTNVNESPTDIGLAGTTVAENQAAGTSVGSLSTLDPDAGDSFTYALAAGAGDADNASFTIDNGVLKTAASFNFEAKNSYAIRVRSTDALGLFIEKEFTIDVTDVGESIPPVLGGITGAAAVVYKENAAVPVLISSAATVTDPDSPNYGGGVLTVWLSNNGTADDWLSIKHAGDTTGKIGVDYRAQIIRFGGVPIANFTGGDGTNPLIITFNSSALTARVQAVLKAINFANESDNPSTLPRTVSFKLVDNDGGVSAVETRTINVTAVNDKPVVTVNNTVTSYTENDAPILIDPGVTVYDADSADFAGGKLLVKSASGGQSTDRYTILPGGLITVAGNAVSYNGTSIGTFAGTNVLTVTLNSAATYANVQELARRIAFSSLSEAPSAAQRQVSFSVSDGDGGTSPALGNVININTLNDAPVLALSNATVAKYNENAAPALISSAGTVVDVDLFDFDGGVLTVEVTGNATAADVLSIKHTEPANAKVSVQYKAGKIFYTTTALGTYEVATFTGGDEGNPLVITFNDDALKTEVQAVFKAITFANSSDNPSTALRTVSFTLTDGDGGTSNTVVRSVDVIAKNDKPELSDFGPSVNHILGGSPTIIADSATVSDIDSDDFLGGTLKIVLGAGKNTLDRVEIADGNGISVSGNTVSYNGNEIGTFAGTTTLTITFNSAFATPDAVQALLRQLTFRTTASTTRLVTVTATLNDGDGGTSAAVSKQINVTNGMAM